MIVLILNPTNWQHECCMRIVFHTNERHVKYVHWYTEKLCDVEERDKSKDESCTKCNWIKKKKTNCFTVHSTWSDWVYVLYVAVYSCNCIGAYVSNTISFTDNFFLFWLLCFGGFTCKKKMCIESYPTSPIIFHNCCRMCMCLFVVKDNRRETRKRKKKCEKRENKVMIMRREKNNVYGRSPSS